MSLEPSIQTQDHDGLILATRLRQARLVLGLTQDDVAGAIAVPRSAISAMEHGHRSVSGLELLRLARVYRRPLGWFLGETPPAIPDDLVAATVALGESDRDKVMAFARFLAHQAVTSGGSGDGEPVVQTSRAGSPTERQGGFTVIQSKQYQIPCVIIEDGARVQEVIGFCRQVGAVLNNNGEEFCVVLRDDVGPELWTEESLRQFWSHVAHWW